MIYRNFDIGFFSIGIVIAILITACNKSEVVDYKAPDIKLSNHPNNVYIRENILNKYGTAIRWEWDQRFLNKDQSADPIKEDLVIPVTKLIEELWIKPFLVLSEDSKLFIQEYMPKELVYIGSYIFESDGEIIFGYAENGARVSLINLNAFDLDDRIWLENQLITMHHEFSHIVHQKMGLPNGYNNISPLGYVGEGWRNGVSLSDAIKRGMVSAYGTRNQFEDFAQLTSHFLVQDTVYFNSTYIKDWNCEDFSDPNLCVELNKGKKLISRKLELIRKFYLEEFSINIDELRDTIQSRMSAYKN
ncbi:substrate import-associated zinc metallohydrolase lipoprotein [Marinifilum fragile]|uniref:substrate import-associated zinc metallohydrolase lipoprotein n=1 Tax=Marinifilum fragile TaxID=570161 RepID=UPI002AA8B8CA|nr:substrate import-associated zinc metallohydrolase lipoprotein [Marinifilum fragile]